LGKDQEGANSSIDLGKGHKKRVAILYSCNPLNSLVEAASGFEPEIRGFADRCLTTWLCRLYLERETGFEPATSTLARLHSTAELFPLNLFF
jgi:hypothetical protein